MSDITHQQAFIAQFSMSILFTIGYFAVVILILLGYMKVPTDGREAFTGLIGVLTTTEVIIIGYWFSRQRQTTTSSAT
jgi:hypothetical protein